MPTKLKAYTIEDILIAMVLASFVIASAFYSYGVIQTAFLTYQKTTEQALEIKTLDVLLKEDFVHADYIVKTPRGIRCQVKGNSVDYIFEQDQLIRSIVGLTEYFDLKTIMTQFQLNKLDVEKNDELIDEIVYSVRKFDKVFYFHYQKVYGANNLIQYTSQTY